ncbi:MAG: hypothetical protein KGZ35_03010 [Truepera sp.]|nr:hypothetical protein [Truepera sp.]
MVEIGDVLQLDGKPVAVTVGGTAMTALSTTSYQGVGRFGPVEFYNVTDVPRIIAPNRLSVEFGTGSEIIVSSADGIYPPTITVTAIDVTGKVSDRDREATANAEVTGEAVFTLSGTCIPDATSCSYTLSGAELGSLSLNWSGVAPIVFGGPDPNSAELTVTVSFESDPGLAPGSTVAFIIEVKSTKAGL